MCRREKRTVSLSDEAWEEAAVLARILDRSRSWVIERLLITAAHDINSADGAKSFEMALLERGLMP